MKRLFTVVAVLGASAFPVIAQEQTLESLMAAGQPIYDANCSSCHAKSGGGFVGPSFIGNERIANDALVIRQIRNGGADMPGFSTKLTPEEILAVGTYIRNSWGNAYGVLVQPAE